MSVSSSDCGLPPDRGALRPSATELSLNDIESLVCEYLPSDLDDADECRAHSVIEVWSIMFESA